MRQHPIIAIATPPGKGGVGVVRYSFPQGLHAETFSKAMFGCLPQARYAQFTKLNCSQGKPIDEGLLLRFAAPASFTGEHVLEFQGHGGPAVLQRVLDRSFEVASTLGIPLMHAEPGEFSQRAFLNQKIDLAQAESIADLIDASTKHAARAAAASLSGEFSKQVHALAQRILDLRVLVEATLDFPEEEIEFLEKANASGQLNEILQIHDELMQRAKQGMRFRDGLKVVLIGPPNVGKSSLLNQLAGDSIAIVSDQAGTTRDRIVQDLNIRGIPLVVTDTAGLRETQDAIELQGIERTLQSARQANVLLVMAEPHLSHMHHSTSTAHEYKTTQQRLFEAPSQDQVRQFLTRWNIQSDIPTIWVLNKIDTLNAAEQTNIKLHLDASSHEAWVFVSAQTGEGMETLKDKLMEMNGLGHAQEHGFMARERHVNALKRCHEYLTEAHDFAQHNDKVLDLFAESLRLAHDALGEITGRVLPDALLGHIFSSFCIGK